MWQMSTVTNVNDKNPNSIDVQRDVGVQPFDPRVTAQVTQGGATVTQW